MATQLGTLAVDLTANTKQFDRSLKGASRSLESVAKSARTVSLVAGAAFAGAGLALGKFVSMASSAGENTDKLSDIFGNKLRQSVTDFTDSLAADVGRSRFELQQFAGDIAGVVKPMLGSAAAAAEMSKGIVALAVDMASFNEVSPERALQALRAGLVGSSEPLLSLGVNLQVAQLEAFAFSKGITKSFQSMSIAEKTAIRYQAILAQTSDQQGNAKSTSESFANQVLALKGTMSDLGTEIGQALIPVALTLVEAFRKVAAMVSGLSPEMLRAGAIAATIATALAGVAAVLAGLVAVLPFVAAGFTALGAAISFAMAPALAIILAVAAAAAGIQAISGFAGAAAGGGLASPEAEAETFGGGGFLQALKSVLGFGEAAESAGAKTKKAGDQANIAAEQYDKAKSQIFKFTDAVKKPTKKMTEAADALAQAKSGVIDFANNTQAAAFAQKEVSLVVTDAGMLLAQSFKDLGSQINTMPAPGDIGATLTAGIEEFTSGLASGLQSLIGQDAASGVANGINAFTAVIGPALIAEKSALTSAMSGVAEGFAAGGPGGAIIGGLAALAAETSEFADILSILNQIMTPLLEIVGDVLEPFVELIGALSGMLVLLVEIVTLLGFLGPVLELLGAATGLITKIVENIAKGIVFVFNTMLEFVARLVRIIPFKGKGLARDIRRKKVDFEAIQPARDEEEEKAKEKLKDVLTDVFKSPKVAVRSFSRNVDTTNSSVVEMGKTADKVSKQLTNVPSGFKTALTRLQSSFAGGGISPLTPAVGVASGGGNIFVEVNDAEEFAKKLDNMEKFKNFSTQGSSVRGGGSPFGVNRMGS